MTIINMGQADFIYYDDHIDEAVRSASEAFENYKQLTTGQRVAFLEQIILEIQAEKSTLVTTAQKETSLPEARLNGEVDRTTNQIRMFISLLQEGSWKNAVIDTAQPQRSPLPKPDLRQIQLPVGVVSVFGASNFPFAFSVAGGDTISALAAGCPVVYKVHNGHPKTSELTGHCIARAAGKTGIVRGVFSMIYTSSNEASISIVTHPLLKAVAFTGSFGGGTALYSAAAARPEPIPVYAEMGSTNPVFLLPGKLKDAAEQVAQAMAASNTLGVGQFCTNPGIISLIASDDATRFAGAFSKHLSELPGGKMLTEGIYQSYTQGIDKLIAKKGLEVISRGKDPANPAEAIPYAFGVTAETFLEDEELLDEYFGPVSIQVMASQKEQLIDLAKKLPGQLTVTVWANDQDIADFGELFRILENKAGRVILNNAPTGVEVTHAMVHGGPFPATTDSRSTSVGSTAIYRFTRPVCYQNFPQTLLPEELKDSNPLKIMRLLNGDYTRAEI